MPQFSGFRMYDGCGGTLPYIRRVGDLRFKFSNSAAERGNFTLRWCFCFVSIAGHTTIIPFLTKAPEPIEIGLFLLSKCFSDRC